MSNLEITYWQAYHRIDPIDSRREDFRAGSIVAAIANILRGKDTPPVEPLDTMPDFDGAWSEYKRSQKAESYRHWLESMMEDGESS